MGPHTKLPLELFTLTVLTVFKATKDLVFEGLIGIFGMAVMPFPCNGILLIQGN